MKGIWLFTFILSTHAPDWAPFFFHRFHSTRWAKRIWQVIAEFGRIHIFLACSTQCSRRMLGERHVPHSWLPLFSYRDYLPKITHFRCLSFFLCGRHQRERKSERNNSIAGSLPAFIVLPYICCCSWSGGLWGQPSRISIKYYENENDAYFLNIALCVRNVFWLVTMNCNFVCSP